MFLSGGCSSETGSPAKTRSAGELKTALWSAYGKRAPGLGPRQARPRLVPSGERSGRGASLGCRGTTGARGGPPSSSLPASPRTALPSGPAALPGSRCGVRRCPPPPPVVCPAGLGMGVREPPASRRLTSPLADGPSAPSVVAGGGPCDPLPRQERSGRRDSSQGTGRQLLRDFPARSLLSQPPPYAHFGVCRPAGIGGFPSAASWAVGPLWALGHRRGHGASTFGLAPCEFVSPWLQPLVKASGFGLALSSRFRAGLMTSERTQSLTNELFSKAVQRTFLGPGCLSPLCGSRIFQSCTRLAFVRGSSSVGLRVA